MKRNFLIIFTILIIFITGIVITFQLNASRNKNDRLDKVNLVEVAHTVFYAPLYVSIENGYFKDEGIDINLSLANGADKVATALLSGDADIGLLGSEATIYVYNSGEKDFIKTFSQLTQKDGSFLVSRNKINKFVLDNLKGKEIIGGRSGGMPEMTLEYALKKNGINPREDVSIDTSVAFAAMSGAFIGGKGDFVTLFEPTASMIQDQGYGYIVASIGELGGNVPYTSFSARKSYIEQHPDLIKKFDKAIQKGINFVLDHSDEEISNIVLKQFPDTSFNNLEKAIKRYREIDAWPSKTNFSDESFSHLQDIMIDYGEIDKKVPYKDLFYQIKRD